MKVTFTWGRIVKGETVPRILHQHEVQWEPPPEPVTTDGKSPFEVDAQFQERETP